jgi:hypothetical protein
MTDLVPESVKSTLQSAVGKAQDALPVTFPSLGGLTNTYHHDHQKPEAHSSHRNAQAEEHHTRHPNAPKDLGEFIETQLVGKIDNEALGKQFPTVEGMWHGYIDVSDPCSIRRLELTDCPGSGRTTRKRRRKPPRFSSRSSLPCARGSPNP